MINPKAQKLIGILVAMAFTIGLVSRWYVSKSTINMGTVRATEDSGPVQITRKLSSVISQYPDATKFVIRWTDTSEAEEFFTITYDRQDTSIVGKNDTGGISLYSVTDDKIHAAAKLTAPIWKLPGCPAGAWED